MQHARPTARTALEDLETAIAETQAKIAVVEEKIAAGGPDVGKDLPRKQRKARALPEHLPRVERVIEPDSIACPCGCGNMVRIGEDRTERLDQIPACYQVIVTIRPKYACPKGRTGVVQAKAPEHLLEGSWPTEALLAQIAVSKHSEHMPLNRQATVMARHGVPIDWKLVTNLPVDDLSGAVEKLGWYALRWKAEVFHKVMNPAAVPRRRGSRLTKG